MAFNNETCPTMKLFPSLTLVSLCAAFAGCTATTQTISFLPNGAVDGVTVVIDDNEIGTVNSEPLNFTVQRPTTGVVYHVVYKKDGYISDDQVLEAYPDSDGLYSFLPDYPVPELVVAENVPAEAAPVAQPVNETPTVVAVVEEPAPEPVEDTAVVAAPEPVQDAPVVSEPEPATVAAAPAPAQNPAPEATPAVAPAEPVAVVPAAAVAVADDEPAPAPAVAEPASAPEAVAAKDDVPVLDPTRTCKDIETELKLLSEQRQSGQLSEKEFQSACAEIEREVRARYGSK